MEQQFRYCDRRVSMHVRISGERLIKDHQRRRASPGNKRLLMNQIRFNFGVWTFKYGCKIPAIMYCFGRLKNPYKSKLVNGRPRFPQPTTMTT
jgi:hypothetical protein